MPISKWNSLVECGDEETSTSCDKLKEASYGRAPLVAGNDNCARELISDQYPSMPYAMNDSKAELRSGSASKPFILPLLQKSSSESSWSVVSSKSDGTLFRWKPDQTCYNRKVIATPDGFDLVYDQNSNVFDNACIGTVSDVDYIAGAIQFGDCEGNMKIKLVFFPKSELITSS